MDLSIQSLDYWLSYIQRCHSQTIAMGLDRIKEVAKKAKLLDFSIPVVTVAGTNGKGSTVAILAKLLQTAGLKVGTYTSPHLIDFKERIQINGRFLSETHLIDAFTKIERFRGEIPLTFFEFTTLVALEIFQTIDLLDVIILEVGMGGRLDAVNILSPMLAIVTSIGLDHQAFLGDSLEEIALEKAGILREKIPVLIGKTAKISTLLAKVQEHHNIVYYEGEHFDFCREEKRWQFGDKANIECEVYLPKNSASLAMAAYTILSDFHFSLPSLREVVPCLNNLVMIGRCHPVVLDKGTVIFDVGHNPDGSKWLAKKIHSLSLKKKIVAVWASMADKDLSGIIEPMKDIIQSWFIGKVPVERAATTSRLKLALASQNIKSVYEFDTILQAFDKALETIKENDLILVFGSFFTVSQVMQKYLINYQYQNNGLLLCDMQDLSLLSE